MGVAGVGATAQISRTKKRRDKGHQVPLRVYCPVGLKEGGKER